MRPVLLALLVACGGGEDPVATTRPLEAADFVPIAVGGIDDRLNSYPWAVALFDGDGDGTEEIYVGTLGNALCLQLPLSAETLLGLAPPPAWQCAIENWGDWGAYILDNAVDSKVYRGTRRSDGGFDWEVVFQPGLLDNSGFRGAVVFEGQLYMLGMNLTRGATVYRTFDGDNWIEASEPGVVAAHGRLTNAVRGALVFDGKLYVASSSSGFVYASADPAPGNWEVVNSEGFVDSGGAAVDTVFATGTSTGDNGADSLVDAEASWIGGQFASGHHQVAITGGTGAGQQKPIVDNRGQSLTIDGTWDLIPDATSTYEVFRPDAPVNGPFWDMAELEGRLYAAPLNFEGGELWSASAPAPGAWRREIAGGFGQHATHGFMDVTTHGDHVYVGTVVYPPLVEDLVGAMATEVLRIDAEGEVDLLVGETRDPGGPDERAPLSGMGPGFDYGGNLYSWEATSFAGQYYLGTFDAALLILDVLDVLYPSGVPPEIEAQLAENLSLDRERWRGFDLYRTADGVDWTAVSLDGFGNRNNYGVRALVNTPWGVLLGAANPIDGFELWLGAPAER